MPGLGLTSVWRNMRAGRVLAFLAVTPLALGASSPKPGVPQGTEAPSVSNEAQEGALFTPQQLAALLPSSVYFQGKTASLQLRNSAGLHFKGGSILWAAIVDTSGYASDIQERYEFYLVTEGPLQVGTSVIQPGAYGAGFPGGHFVVMDVGGHTVAQGTTQEAPATIRPRPLQLLVTAPDAVSLCLRRQCVTLRATATKNARP